MEKKVLSVHPDRFSKRNEKRGWRRGAVHYWVVEARLDVSARKKGY